MKKKALSLLLAFCMLLTLLPTSVLATSYTGRSLYADPTVDLSGDKYSWLKLSHNLSGGTYGEAPYQTGATLGEEGKVAAYYLDQDMTFDATGDGGTNGLKIEENATVVIYLNGYTLTVKGHAGDAGGKGDDGGNAISYLDSEGTDGASKGTNGATGGYAGILLPVRRNPAVAEVDTENPNYWQSSNLIFVGTGTVNVTGGAAGKGGKAGAGGNGDAYALALIGASHWNGGGAGAAGGGGAGAGAGIGTNGTAAVGYGETMIAPKQAGNVYFYMDAPDSIQYTVKGGAAGALGDDNENGTGKSDTIYWAPLVEDDISGEGGGKGGRGAGGGAGADFGSGGYGGTAGSNGSHGRNADSSTYGGEHNTAGTDGTTGKAAGAVDNPDGEVKTPTRYVLAGMTVESKFNDLYIDANAETHAMEDATERTTAKNAAINDLLDNADNLDVWAYYNEYTYNSGTSEWEPTVATFDQVKALKGDYDYNSNWRLWKLRDKRDTGDYSALLGENGNPLGRDIRDLNYLYTVAVTDVAGTPAKKQITVTYNPIDHDTTHTSTITASTTVNLLDQYAKDQDGTGTKVGGGDAVKFNDETGFVVYNTSNTPEDATSVAQAKKVFAAGFKRVQYVNKNYTFENLTQALNLGTLNTADRAANKTYTVQYRPYNAYIDEDVAANGHYGDVTMTTSLDTDKYILGAANDFKDYNALKTFNFRNAGLYTITERVTRNGDQYKTTGDHTNDKCFDRLYYVVIEQADLEISNAIDTVTHNTTVQDHTFDREVIGQNDEKVQGQYTFASNNATSTQNTYCYGESWADANAQNQSANKNTPDITGIAWEFNVKHTYNTTDIGDLEQNGPGDRNMNNYLDQNDGTNLSRHLGENTTIGGTAINGTTLKADRNTFYSGNNGELHYAASGVAVLKDNDHLTVQAKYEADQKITENEAGSDNNKTAWTDLNSSDNVTGTITSVFAEDVAFGAKFSNEDYGFRVNEGDYVSGVAFGGTPVTTIPSITFTSGANVQFSKLVENKQYKGDYYVVTVKNSSGVVKSWEYNDTNNVTPTTANVPVGSEYELKSDNTWDAFEAGTYTVYVDYIGLYYQNTTGASGREPGWSGTESFNWVTASKSFTLTIAPRNIAYKPMNDLYKVYDGTALLVKDTLSTSGENKGDVIRASAYIIDLTNGSYTAGQFAKGLSNTVDDDYTTGTNNDDAMYNFLQPTDTSTKYTPGYHTNLKLELAGTYAQSGKAAGSQNVTVPAARLLYTADKQNYNLIPVSNQALSGEVFVAQMYVTHDMTAAVKVRDTTPMRDVLNLHAKAYMPSGRTMSYGTDGYLASAVDFYKQELVDKNDVTKKTSVYPTSSSTSYDYDATYELVLNSNSEAYIAHTAGGGYTANNDGFEINGDTGAVTQVAKLTSNNTNPANFLKVTMTLEDFGNYVVVKQSENTEQHPFDTYGQCAESNTRNGNRNTTVYSVKEGVNIGTGASDAETLSHTILYYMAGNGDTFNLYLPINQLNKRSVDSVFANAVGTAHDVTVGNEKYQYVTVYENGDSAEFTFTVPQDSYLEDVKIVALGTTDSVPAFENIVTTNPVGKFSDNTNGKISTTYGSKKCELTLELIGVNAKSDFTTNSLYFNSNVAANAGYTATKLADANEQIGGSTYTFRFTTGESEMGTECKLVIVPVIKKFSPILGETAYASNVSVEKVTSATDGALTFTFAENDFIYVNYKTLWDTTAGVSGQHGTVNMSYTAAGASSATTLPQQELGANLKDQYNSFGINTEAEGNTAFFDPAKLIPGTVVSVTLKVWRNGVVAGLQSSTDADAMDKVTFTWTVTPEDYYRLFKDDVVVFRSSNKMEANADLATKQELTNIYGYGITNAPASMKFTEVTFVSNAASATKKTKNILTTYADTWYLCGGTRRVIDASAKTMSDLALGDNLYPTYNAPIGGGGAAVTTTTVTSTMPMLRKGNTGDAVKTLQTKLNALGYNCGAVDGVFGNDTYNAVVKYQKAMGITVDGVVGKGTWGKLGVTGTIVTVAATTSVTSTTTTSATSNMPMLRKGNTGDAVKTLQTKLNALGHNCGAVDGVFGTNTYNAVVKFQKDKGLRVDGVVGNQTWAKLG